MKTGTRISWIAFALLLWISLPAAAHAAGLSIFVDFGDIPGESKDANHTNWIEAAAVSEGLLGEIYLGPGSVTPAKFSDVRIIKSLDKASVKLREAAAKGMHFPGITIEFTMKSDSSKVILSVKLKEVQVTEVSMSVNTLDSPQEIVAVSFERICWEYTSYKPDGTPSGTVAECWDILRQQSGE